MEALFLLLREKLKTIPELKWVDWDNGQLDEPHPPIAFPAALIEIDLPKTDNIDRYFQHIECSFNIRLVFKALGETNANAPIEQVQKALTFFKTADKVYDLLQGFKNEQFFAFERNRVTNRKLRPGLKVVDIPFTTSWRERSANS